MQRAIPYDVEKIRNDFPILERKVNGKTLVYLDNAATSQKPKQVVASMTDFYLSYNANIHRAVHTLSQEATDAYEGARERVARFVHARHSEEIVFVRNATEAINLVAYSWGRANVKRGDLLVLTEMEHHSNIVPWLLLSREVGAKLEYVPITEDGTLDTTAFDNLIERRPRLVCVTHVSNVLGSMNPINEMVRKAHAVGATVLVDGAQSVPHMPVDVQLLACDFLAFTGHKMLGPTGIGALYGKQELLEAMPPFIGGGDMIKEVHLHDAAWNEVPWKFEAGTSNIAGGIGFGAAVDYLVKVGMENVHAHEKLLTEYGLKRLMEIQGLELYGPTDAKFRGAIISFNIGDIHAHDLASILDGEGIAIRSGHHCAQPLMERLGVPATSRASFYVYNTLAEIDRLIEGLEKARRIFKL